MALHERTTNQGSGSMYHVLSQLLTQIIHIRAKAHRWPCFLATVSNSERLWTTLAQLWTHLLVNSWPCLINTRSVVFVSQLVPCLLFSTFLSSFSITAHPQPHATDAIVFTALTIAEKKLHKSGRMFTIVNILRFYQNL